ncbi:LLM class flavin-dependent oxidoreductase [Streptomyces sp. NBC_00249]|uniref:MupA/Atu3671 family FMN-dependent luciferase-like monooxygenase n=1 Tax=Streptomyces sp. NBC_00249 TaxID=2975690 RepID=UPI00225B0197|nr:MupA/Atu3671 family FMN-dependent luciferase-like monooxygenase [Streptomyces sp. NBC_00249]MCX5195238.1 LLM class flavin-dependent oxidoreductase [Streptomyces sp. NBC_00249]
MDFSLFYFGNDEPDPEGAGRYDLVLEGARFADTHDFAAVWTPERHFHPFGGLYPNPAVTGAALAAATSRVAIRAGSVVAPLHHPLRIAEEWAVVDNISGGRVGLAFASGWHATDFALRPEAYENRREVLVDTVRQVRELWRGEEAEVLDGTGTARRVRSYPRPVQREVPVWITSAGGVETFRAAGALGAGVLTHLLGQDPAELAEKTAAYREAYTAREGAVPGDRGHVVCMVHTLLGEDEEQTRELVRAPLTRYLRSSVSLLLASRAHGGARTVDPAKLRDKDLDFLAARAFDRHYEDGGLLGTLPKAARVVERLGETGVDELACLIDFGAPAKTVLDALPLLDELRRNTA